jgi:Fe-Mn family superoxide dismutase
MDRRVFLVTTGAGAVGLAAGIAACGAPRTAGIAPAATDKDQKEDETMAIKLPPLPYDVAALEPHLTKENLELHHGKHHNAYVVNLNKLIEEGKADGSKSLEELILAAPEGPVFNNAAQVWNHTFYWHCMKPGGGGRPSGALMDAINRDFGSFEKFQEEFASASVSQFGSGWGWLVVEGGKLKVTKTSNADLPLKHGQTALLTCDVWEHAYYPSFKNLRPKYVEVFLANLVDWDFVAKNLAAA